LDRQRVKFENISEVKGQWRNEFGTQPPTRLTIACIRNKFDIYGTVGDVHKERSRRPRTATTVATSAAVLQQFTRSPQKCVKQCSRETGASRSNVQRILKSAMWKLYFTRLLHAMNEDDTDRRLEYCEWFESIMSDDEAFAGKVVWSDEAQFKPNGTVRPDCSRTLHRK
jgi:hypothetical protein